MQRDDEPGEFDERLREALARLAAAFELHRVSHALIGGLAVGLRARPRSTMDIDLLISVPQLMLPRLLEDLHRQGFSPSPLQVIADWQTHHLAVLWYSDVRIDWLKPVLPVYDHVLRSSEPVRIGDQTISVASAEGLIVCKLIADRPQDRADIASLVTARGTRLNLAWIEHEWQSVGGEDDPRIVELRKTVAAANAAYH